MKCNQFCKTCQGQSCDNASATSFVLEEDENEDEEEDDDDGDGDDDDDGSDGDDDDEDDNNDDEEENTVKDEVHEENEASINTGRLTVKNRRSKVSTQKV